MKSFICKVLGVILLIITGCCLSSDKLSPSGVHQLEVVHLDDGKGNERIHLSGLAMNSTHGIGRVRTEKCGKGIDLEVTMRYRRSPTLDIDIPIQSDTEFVSWQGSVIWQRK